jgi:uncharacterized protein (TIGR03067 family)
MIFLYPSAAREDEKSVVGTWVPVSAVIGGKEFPEEVTKSIKMTLTETNYTVDVGGKIDKGTYTLDKKAKIKTLEIKGTEGPNKDKTFKAIYEFKGDNLRVCYDLSGAKYPTEFKSEPNTLLFLAEYKREKK